jgi:putative transposase
VREQCRLLGLHRANLYYEPVPESAENLHLMKLMDQEYLRHPFYGSRRMATFLETQGHTVNRKKVQRLMGQMGLVGLAPQPRTTIVNQQDQRFPYLLRGLEITRPDQVWCSDITYIPLRHGYLYLVAVMDWFSRHVLSWRLSNSMDTDFCIEALQEALSKGQPEIFNTDQGSQFTSRDYTNVLQQAEIAISRDGRGRALDNVMIERLWRSVKYENIYIKDYRSGDDCYQGLQTYFQFYGYERRHQSLGKRTPWEIYRPSRTRTTI